MPLIEQHNLASHSPFGAAVHADLAARLTPPSDFPCTFSQNAFRRGLLVVSLVTGQGDAGFAKGAADLAAYVDECRTWDGQVNTARPLLMVFAQPFADVESAHAHGWAALQYWHDSDPNPWPDGVSRDPETPFWSFCYAGMQLFVNMSVPGHGRKSRDLGRYLTLVINPRERFDIVAGDTKAGRKVRANIRARAEAYDGLPHSPLLGSFEKGELEWVQYALPSDNATPPGRCPFRQRR